MGKIDKKSEIYKLALLNCARQHNDPDYYNYIFFKRLEWKLEKEKEALDEAQSNMKRHKFGIFSLLRIIRKKG